MESPNSSGLSRPSSSIPTQPENRVNKANRSTFAAKYNRKMLDWLGKQLAKNPEADIINLLSSTYSAELQEHISSAIAPPISTNGTSDSKPSLPAKDIRSRLNIAASSTIICELSAEVEELFRPYEDLSAGLVSLLSESDVLYESSWAASVMVFRLSENIVVKITGDKTSPVNEHQSLGYLQQHLPAFPAPRPHGVIRHNKHTLLFTSLVPGITLEKMWPQLDKAGKHNISSQLDTLLSTLRSLPHPEDAPLGGVQGGGVKDTRRFVRRSPEQIMDVRQFEDFIFAGSKTASPLYTDILRGLMPASPAKCVFTHGDIRPANIMVSRSEDGTLRVEGIIDWESSGFYPEYWDCVKATNNLTPSDKFDWYHFLPEPISSKQYPLQWLIDRLWDRNLVNS
ncbi:hypothetical protein CkaCkLH20_05153 [Colletotrichum karsti]|uniref:Aminoglycoside phosphotransferase domain-containing protein n=1 Tax=Colletotrichum karsti TaxID=1095194 RepID=A0A9P6LL70_9PEZI|nr:uncharacterized protein CkaCkLH20_05153 [Colletotrichum karsti]KAF9877453.1 hypothetical protein CkaCkLH20_05153 [Colletotrichum karsti]